MYFGLKHLNACKLVRPADCVGETTHRGGTITPILWDFNCRQTWGAKIDAVTSSLQFHIGIRSSGPKLAHNKVRTTSKPGSFHPPPPSWPSLRFSHTFDNSETTRLLADRERIWRHGLAFCTHSNTHVTSVSVDVMRRSRRLSDLKCRELRLVFAIPTKQADCWLQLTVAKNNSRQQRWSRNSKNIASLTSCSPGQRFDHISKKFDTNPPQLLNPYFPERCTHAIFATFCHFLVVIHNGSSLLPGTVRYIFVRSTEQIEELRAIGKYSLIPKQK